MRVVGNRLYPKNTFVIEKRCSILEGEEMDPLLVCRKRRRSKDIQVSKHRKWILNTFSLIDYLLNRLRTLFHMCIKEEERRYFSMITY